MKTLLIPLDYYLNKGCNQPLAKYGEAVFYESLQQAIDFKPDLIVYQGSVPVEDCRKLKQETNALRRHWR